MRGLRWLTAAAALFSLGLTAAGLFWVFGGGHGTSGSAPTTRTDDTIVPTTTGGATTGVATATDPNDTSATTTDPTTTGPSEPTYASLEEYQRRCERIDQQGALALVVYETSKEMDVGVSETVRAAVTLDQSAPPAAVLPGTEAAGERGIVISCRLQARLSASRYEFDVDDKNWIDRAVYTTDTARWVWRVTPKLGGTRTLTLFVRPIVVWRDESRAVDATLVAESDVREYTTRVRVSVPWNKRPEEIMTQLASLLNVAEGVVQALTVLILALAALGAALGFRRRKTKNKPA